jgi:hypothetical protein
MFRRMVRIVADLRFVLWLILLALIAANFLLWNMLNTAGSIYRSIPYVENCGSSSNPCQVEITHGF